MGRSFAPQAVIETLPNSGEATDDRPGSSVFPLRTVSRLATIGLFTLGVCYVLVAAKMFIMPLVVGAVIALVVNPIGRQLRRIGIPRPAAAGLLVVGILGLITFGIVSLIPPLKDWAARAPAVMGEVEEKFRPIKESIEAVEQATESVEAAAGVAGSEGANTPQTVVVQGRGVLSNIALVAPAVIVQLALTVAFTFFFLFEGWAIRRRLILMARTTSGRLRVARTCNDIQRHVANYLLMVAAINVGLGVTTGVVAYAAGLPNPLLWGTGMAILNFVPFLGPAIMILVVFAVGIVTLPTVGMALIAPLGFFVLNIVESQFVTPFVLGRRLLASPLAIFASVAFGGWLWGVVGALVAVPLLILTTTLYRHSVGAPRLP